MAPNSNLGRAKTNPQILSQSHLTLSVNTRYFKKQQEIRIFERRRYDYATFEG